MVGPRTIANRKKQTTNRVRAKDMCRNAVAPEKIFWAKLRDRRLAGHKFKRQVLVGTYIADFACLEGKVIVELDGPFHEGRVEFDKKRDAYLKKHGFRVLRFSNAKIADSDLALILGVLKSPSPRPSPPKGERENSS
jgi:very-short-patch-repair endonuclease